MKTYLLLLLLGFCQVVLAQRYNFMVYSLEQGLPQSEIYAIAQDRQGAIWVATHDGSISRFDGKRFLPLALPKMLKNLTINYLLFDQNNILWIGTNYGLYQYDGTAFREITDQAIFTKNPIENLKTDREGKIWVTVRSHRAGKRGRPQLWQLDKQKWYNRGEAIEQQDEYFGGMAINQKGDILVGTTKGRLLGWTGSSFTTYRPMESSYAQKLEKEQLSFYLLDNEKKAWFGEKMGQQSYLICFSDSAIRKIALPKTVQLNPERKAALEDSKGNLWFTMSLGLLRLNPKTEAMTFFSQNNGLETGDIIHLFEDREGVIWIGTQGKGLIRFGGERFVHFSRKDGMANDLVWRITEDTQGRMWFGTNPTYSFFDGEKINNLFHTPETAVQYVWNAACTPDGSVWITTKEMGLVEYSNNKLIPFGEKKWEKAPPIVWNMMNLPSKKICMMSPNELRIYSPDRKLLQVIDTTVIAAKWLRGAYATEDREGNIWYFGESTGIFKYDGKKVQQLDTLGFIMGYADQFGRMWNAGFGNGFWVMDTDGKNKRQITTADGLSSDIVYSVWCDHQGNIWAGTQNGLDKIVLDDKGNIKKIKNYGKAEGFTGVETNGWAIYEDSKHHLWVGHINGVTRYNPAEDLPNPNPPSVQIAKLNLFLKETNWADSAYQSYYQTLGQWSRLPEQLRLPADQNHLTFQFFGLNYRAPEKVRYKWKLLPIESEWSVESDRTEAVYANLSPQNYTFMVQACNEDGIWSKPISYEFTIMPPFWQTWWFRTLSLGLVFGLTFTGVRIRIKQIESQKAKLEKLVDQRTAEVVRQKNEILAKNTILEQQKEEIVSQNDQINKQNREILDKNEELVVALEIIDKKNKDITASIHYAKRIQTAILPFENRIEQAFPDYFILFRPRDIVSGDFYWFFERDAQKFIAAIDCTGHGIPGAFMSMIGDSLLNQIVSDRKVYEVNLILTEMHKGIRHALKQAETESRDGMDMAICRVDQTVQKLYYAGAKNPLYYLQNGEMQMIKADRFPIGGVQWEWEQERTFTKHEIDIQTTTVFYIFTDGFQDQFGGETKQKFLSKNFRNLLFQIHQLPMPQQREQLDSTMTNWIGTGRQLDDILVIGVRV